MADAKPPKTPGKPGNPAWAKGPDGKGKSGNPGGRDRVPEEVREALRALTPRALQILTQLLESTDEKIQVQAMREVLDRNLGKAVQPTDNVHSGSVGGLVVSFVKAPQGGSK
jgi:hypothetical protein